MTALRWQLVSSQVQRHHDQIWLMLLVNSNYVLVKISLCLSNKTFRNDFSTNKFIVKLLASSPSSRSIQDPLGLFLYFAILNFITSPSYSLTHPLRNVLECKCQDCTRGFNFFCKECHVSFSLLIHIYHYFEQHKHL